MKLGLAERTVDVREALCGASVCKTDRTGNPRDVSSMFLCCERKVREKKFSPNVCGKAVAKRGRCSDGSWQSRLGR